MRHRPGGMETGFFRRRPGIAAVIGITNIVIVLRGACYHHQCAVRKFGEGVFSGVLLPALAMARPHRMMQRDPLGRNGFPAFTAVI